MSGSFYEHLRSPLGSILVGLVFGTSLIMLHVAYSGPGTFTPVNGWGSIKQVSGSVGMGFSPTDSNPGSTLAIKGNASVGSQYVGIAAPKDGLIVEGSLGVGTSNPFGRLEVRGGGILLNGTAQRGYPNERIPQGNNVIDTGNQNPAAATPLSITIGKDGLPLIAYVDDKNTQLQDDDTLKILRCADIQCKTFLGGTPIHLADTPSGRFVNLLVGFDGIPVLVYQKNDSGIPESDIVFAKCSDAKCSSLGTSINVEQNITYGNVYPAAVTAIDGSTLIAYLFTGDIIRLMRCTIGGCNNLKDISHAIGFSGHTTIAVGVDGFPVITAISRDAPRRIHFIHCQSVDCSTYDPPIPIDIASGSSDVGKYASMSIGADGFPVISYLDEDSNDLKVLKCETATCNVHTSMIIEASPGLDRSGINTSLTIGVDGLPIVAYTYIGANSRIIVAKCGNVGCSDGAASVASIVVPDTEFGDFASIAIGADGLPIIAYVRYTSTNRIRIVHCGSQNCVPYWTRR